MEPLQRSRDAGIGNAQDRVVVVAEQNVREELELKAPPDGREPVEEVVAVLVVDEQVPIVAAVGTDVVDALGEGARTAWHPARLGVASGPAWRAYEVVTPLAHFSLDKKRGPTPLFAE